MNTTPSSRPTDGVLVRWAALGGIAYVVLFVVGSILLFSGTPDGDAPPSEVVKYYMDSGHRDKIGIGWIIAGLGVFFFLWFLSRLRQTVRQHEGGDGFLTTLTTIGGAVYAALAFAALGLNMGIRTMSDDTFHHQVYPGLIHAADDAGYVLHATGGAGAAAMIIAASLAAMRAAVIPAWAGWLGIVAGIVSLASIAFIPMLVLALWIVIASVLMFLRGRDTPAVPATMD
jgi:hypothetical protein